jgi:hypothetical protein
MKGSFDGDELLDEGQFDDEQLRCKPTPAEPGDGGITTALESRD